MTTFLDDLASNKQPQMFKYFKKIFCAGPYYMI